MDDPNASPLSRVRRALAGKRVLLTGHTGFKGAWLSLWLSRLGAEVTGIALPPRDERDLFVTARIGDLVETRVGDIRHEEDFARAAEGVDADLVIHMAAQALVRPSYERPVETIATNVTGTAVVLEAARRMPSLSGVIVVTSDKCYENREWVWGYRESDPMGGADPYSASKGCTELIASAYRRSFFSQGQALLASVRAGNVFGGGDWSQDRLGPDLAKAAIAGETVTIRNPASVRPWQFVLEPLWGYLLVAERLLSGDASAAEGWNFGPDPAAVAPVGRFARAFRDGWGGRPELSLGTAPGGPHEAKILRLDSTKAQVQLGWSPALSFEAAIGRTVSWYRGFAEGADMRALSLEQIETYEDLACASAPAAAPGEGGRG
ncbi:CDP-glucose 4,6-dehydratase [Parvularcula oceani]|uniref:CDP-glucose 4,6-dehydratase n=1 Tax=Parvularcula oceani TaxID=1247963 RepID=UPI00068E7EF0|nr:CDP-glucose 4,6-dehydratase [Parvularcula oceani]